MARPGFQAQISDFYQKRFPVMSRYAAARVSDSGAGDDLAQSAMTTLLARGSLDDISNLDGYAFGILKNGMKAFRKANTTEFLPLRSIQWEATDEPAVSDIADDYVSQESARELQALIADCLDPTESRHFALRFSGLKPREIAKHETDAGYPTTAEAVRWSLANSRAKIRRRLEPCIAIHYAWDIMTRRLRSSISAIKRSLAPGDMLQTLSRSMPNICQSILEMGVAISAFVSPPATGALARELPPQSPEVTPSDSFANTFGTSQLALILYPVYESDEPAFRLAKERVSSSSVRATTLQVADPHPTSVADQEFSNPKDASVPDIGNEAPTGFPGITEDGEFKLRDPAGGEATLSRRTESSSEPAPPLTDQTLDLVENPEKMPLPQCWGLPLCEQLPKRLEIQP